MLAMDMTPLLMVSRILVATSDRSHHPRASISSLTMTTRELDTLAVSYLRHNSQSTVLKTLTNTETDRLYLLSPVFPTISTRKNYIYMTRTGDHQLYLELWGSMNTRGKAGNICTEYSHAYQSPEEALKYFFQDGWKPNNGTYDPTVPRSLEQKLFCVAHIVRCMTSWLYANDSVATDIGRLTYSQFHIEATAWAIVNIVVDLHERGGRFMRGIIKSEPSGQLSMDRRLSAKQRSQKIRYLLATWKSACDDALEGAWIQSIVLNPLIYRFRKIEARGTPPTDRSTFNEDQGNQRHANSEHNSRRPGPDHIQGPKNKDADIQEYKHHQVEAQSNPTNARVTIDVMEDTHNAPQPNVSQPNREAGNNLGSPTSRSKKHRASRKENDMESPKKTPEERAEEVN